MDEYIKVSVSLKERLLFLFTGLIHKKYVISISKKSERVITTNESKSVVIDEEKDDFRVDIPFFELDDKETKSNL